MESKGRHGDESVHIWRSRCLELVEGLPTINGVDNRTIPLDEEDHILEVVMQHNSPVVGAQSCRAVPGLAVVMRNLDLARASNDDGLVTRGA